MLLHRDAIGVSAYRGISSARARAILSGGEQRALTVCVEDVSARSLLRALIRSQDAALLKVIGIEAIGSNAAVREAVKLLTRLNRNS